MFWKNLNELFGQPNICHILFIYSSVHGHLGYFHLLPIVNNAAMDMGVELFVQDPAFNSLICKYYWGRKKEETWV